jgi:hypothetical protein
MTVVVPKGAGFEERLRREVGQVIEGEIDKILNEVTLEAEKTLRKRIRDAVASVGIRVASAVTMERTGQTLRIEVSLGDRLAGAGRYPGGDEG